MSERTVVGQDDKTLAIGVESSGEKSRMDLCFLSNRSKTSLSAYSSSFEQVNPLGLLTIRVSWRLSMSLNTLAVDLDDVLVRVYAATQFRDFSIDRNNTILNPRLALSSRAKAGIGKKFLQFGPLGGVLVSRIWVRHVKLWLL